MELNTELFETITTTPSLVKSASVAKSEIIERPSTQTKANVEYVRLSDSDHDELLIYVRAINILRTDKEKPREYIATNNILDRNSGIWGSKLRKFSTLREVLEGVTEKLARPHKYVKGRTGEDLSVKQLTAINQIISALGCNPISIPVKEV